MNFNWKILEVTSDAMIVYENFGAEEHEVFKKDNLSIIEGKEDELVITDLMFNELKRDCGESPEKRFCTINEYRKLGKELNDIPEDVLKTDKNITSPEDTCIVMVSAPGVDKQNYFICSDNKEELDKINTAMSLVASNTPVKKQKNLLQYFVAKAFITVMVEVNETEVKIYKCDVKEDPLKCLEDGNDQTAFYESYKCKDQLFEPASGFKSDTIDLDLEKYKESDCFIMNV